MPPKTYMVVDPRHDHSMRIPRPDLSVELGTPNACNNCHKDKAPKWAAKQVEGWYGHTPAGFQTYASTLRAAREQAPDAGKALAALIRDPQAPPIARATALTQLGPYLSASNLDVLETGLVDESPMVREAALTLLDSVPPAIGVRLAFPLLSDPVRAVRVEAARVLAGIPGGELSNDQQALLENRLKEYVIGQQAMAERPEVQTNLGNFHAAQGKLAQAVSAYKTAIELNLRYAPAYVNLADLYRSRGDEAKAEKILRQALAVLPESGAIEHALGLSLVRQKRIGDAIESLEKAAKYSPDNARYIYVYAVALNSAGDRDKAIMVLKGAQRRFPFNTDILSALVAFHRDAGNPEAARTYADKLLSLSP
jgi:tetratricopeptide (TPR) repeat protein